MSGTFTEITKSEFDSVMEAHGYAVDESLSGRENTKEYVYSKYIGQQVKLVCYSSIDQRDDEGRGCGKDAIRLVALYVDPNSGDTHPINTDSRTYRVDTWKKNLTAKLEELDKTPPRPFFCKKCGKVMRVRKRKADKKPFLGCTGYPDCKGGMDIPGSQPNPGPPSSVSPTPTTSSLPVPEGCPNECETCPNRVGNSGKYCQEQKTHLWAAVKKCSVSASKVVTTLDPSVSPPVPAQQPTPTPTLPVPEGCPSECKDCEQRGGKTGKYCRLLKTHLWAAVKEHGCPNQRDSFQTHSGRCDECGGPGAKYDRTDSSGIPGKVCDRCSYLNSYELSFA